MAVELEQLLVAEPILVSAAVPAGEVCLGNRVRERRCAGFAERPDDVAVADAIAEHGINAVAGGLGEAGDFPETFAARPAVRAWGGMVN